MTHLAVMGQAPHYLQGAENPAVVQALLTVVSRVLDLGLDVSQLDEAVQRFRTRCDAAMAEDPAAQAEIRRMEQDYDAEGRAAWHTRPEEPLNAERLMQDVENFLREEREGGSEVHSPPNLVVTPRASHHMLDLSMRYPHDVSSAPMAICMEMRHGTACQTETRKPHHHHRFPR
jgi:hypothetical protein